MGPLNPRREPLRHGAPAQVEEGAGPDPGPGDAEGEAGEEPGGGVPGGLGRCGQARGEELMDEAVLGRVAQEPPDHDGAEGQPEQGERHAGGGVMEVPGGGGVAAKGAFEGEAVEPGHVEGGEEGPGEPERPEAVVAGGEGGEEDLVLGPEPGQGEDPGIGGWAHEEGERLQLK